MRLFTRERNVIERTDGVQGASSLIFLVVMVAIFYFLLIRPQKKRVEQHRQLVALHPKQGRASGSRPLLDRYPSRVTASTLKRRRPCQRAS